MPSPLTPSTNGTKKRKVVPETQASPKARNGVRSSFDRSHSPTPNSSPSKGDKIRRHTVGSLRRLFGGSQHSLESEEGNDDSASVKSGRASSPNDRPSEEAPPKSTVSSEHHCREQELEQSLNAMKLEMKRLEDRVRLLAAENDGYQKEMIVKHKELEDRETTVLVLKHDVELEKEKVKIIEEDKNRLASSLAMESSIQVIELQDAEESQSQAQIHTSPSSDPPAVSDTDMEPELEPESLTQPLPDHPSSSLPTSNPEIEPESSPRSLHPSAELPPLPTSDTETELNTNREAHAEEGEEKEEDQEDQEDVSGVDGMLDQTARDLANLTSMDNTNSTLRQRVDKFNDIRSQLKMLVDELNMEAVQLHRELNDRVVSRSLLFCFSLMFFFMLIFLFAYFYEFLSILNVHIPLRLSTISTSNMY